jgi:hypothetical protein
VKRTFRALSVRTVQGRELPTRTRSLQSRLSEPVDQHGAIAQPWQFFARELVPRKNPQFNIPIRKVNHPIPRKLKAECLVGLPGDRPISFEIHWYVLSFGCRGDERPLDCTEDSPCQPAPTDARLSVSYRLGVGGGWARVQDIVTQTALLQTTHCIR